MFVILVNPLKVHHKFAVIDSALSTHRVITGSANWSLSSYHNYNENIVFFDQEPEVARPLSNGIQPYLEERKRIRRA